MNLEELRRVQSKERRTDSLQNLRPSFYQEVGEYIAGLKADRERAAEQASDPFSAPEVNRLTDEIETATDVVEAIYERRMGKLVKQASLAAAGMAADDEGLTAEEADLFDGLVDRIQANKGRVLDVLDGAESGPPADVNSTNADPADVNSTNADPADVNSINADPTGGESSPGPSQSASKPAASTDADVAGSASETTVRPDAPTESADVPPAPPDVPSDPDNPPSADGSASATDESVSAADVMGGERPSTDGGTSSVGSVASPGAGAGDEAPTDTENGLEARPAVGRADQHAADADRRADDGPETAESVESAESVDRVTVRITRDVGSILGIDDREYTLEHDDVVTLPEQNAAPLVEREAAEPLE